MKYFALLTALLFSVPSFAITWQVVGQGGPEPIHFGMKEVDLKNSAGEITVDLLKKNGIPFVGNTGGIRSILNTPYGDKATVIVNDRVMRVYGWCFSVDGVIPDVMPDKYYFVSQEATMKWFFAYSLYDSGEWKEFCTPAYKKPLVDLE